MKDNPESGLIHLPSHRSVDETVTRLQSLLQEKNITLFALVDHSGEAERVGLQMRPTKLMIFGNPKGGTPVMQAAPTSAIDLPLKALIWEDAEGKVWLTYNDPAYLRARHGFPAELLGNLSGVNAILVKAAE
jgi:uncharacterized protein (DUF302 family)